jgi:translocator protein
MASKHPWIGLCVFLALCFAAAAIGGAVTGPQIDGWYAALHKPGWNPPNGVFGPVWTVLYACMAVAAWLVWRQDGLRPAKFPLTLFGVQLALNVLWSCVFFGLQLPGLAFAELIVLWSAIAATTAAFWRRSAVAGILLLPYLAWVAFAGVLNFAVWRLNA